MSYFIKFLLHVLDYHSYIKVLCLSHFLPAIARHVQSSQCDRVVHYVIQHFKVIKGRDNPVSYTHLNAYV